ncbi:MAG: hypothetical protein PHN50_03275 [Bacteroidales bacterium]|nr:hypothetical protein [Bacteroidales bacterium]
MLNPNPVSKHLPISRTVLEIAVLSLIGLAAVAIRTKLRIPLNMPGHHGLEVMAILLIGRHWAKLPLASSISSLSAALFLLLPWAGIKDPFIPFIYILMGIVIDLLYRFTFSEKRMLFSLLIIGSIAYSIIPLSRLMIHLSVDYPYGSFLKTGYFYPVFSHFIFGAAGGLLAGLLIKAQQKITK